MHSNLHDAPRHLAGQLAGLSRPHCSYRFQQIWNIGPLYREYRDVMNNLWRSGHRLRFAGATAESAGENHSQRNET